MSKQANLRQIQSFLKVLLIHLIKNQIEQRLTNSWAASIRNSVREIQKINLKENKKSYYVNQDAIADASLEVMNGTYSQFKLADLINRQELIQNALKLLSLTYSYSPKQLPRMVAETLTQLPGGEDWRFSL